MSLFLRYFDEMTLLSQTIHETSDFFLRVVDEINLFGDHFEIPDLFSTDIQITFFSVTE